RSGGARAGVARARARDQARLLSLEPEHPARARSLPHGAAALRQATLSLRRRGARRSARVPSLERARRRPAQRGARAHQRGSRRSARRQARRARGLARRRARRVHPVERHRGLAPQRLALESRAAPRLARRHQSARWQNRARLRGGAAARPLGRRRAGVAGERQAPGLVTLTHSARGAPADGRRKFLATLLGGAAAAWGVAAQAQQPRKIYRVGLLVSGAPMGATDKRRQTLLSVLTAHGFVDGQNLVFVQRSADARPERLDGLAAELKAANVDVIVTFGYPAALPAKKSTRDIPIVISAAGDPVATGLVDGVARPGGNITGVTELSTELSAKRLEILRDAVPALARVAMLWNAADLGMTLRYRAAEDAASLLGIKVQTLGVREP